MNDRPNNDIVEQKSGLYEIWIRYTFDVAISDSEEPVAPFPGSAEDALNCCLRFFRSPSDVLSKVSRNRACKALRFIPSIDGYGGLLSFKALPESERKELCHAHFDLFNHAFRTDDYDGAAFMWWEYLVGAKWDDGDVVSDDRWICRELLSCLARILTTESEICMRSALHGLNEFGPFADRELAAEIIHEFLRREGIPDSIRTYANEVLAGNAP
jgi:hypothetical protein